MALYVLVFLGTTPVGASLAGWWAENFGVPSSIWAAGLVCVAASVVALIWQLRSNGERLSLQVRNRPHLSLVRPAVAADAAAEETAGRVAAGSPESARSAARKRPLGGPKAPARRPESGPRERLRAARERPERRHVSGT
jgi:hypothetical protein